jgi:S-DNA-T family DNA segregation ATPase FtsK/SpoIIIE
VAGATNSGKTVCLNSIIISLLYQNQPDELKFILVDPKRVEMTSYENIPYLLTPVVTEVKKTINALKWTISEMERRFHVLAHAGKRNIQSYNMAHADDKLPYIVFIIDELATLMSIAGPEVEAAIIRLAQMARAVGIHLILATQRPSVDIITGLIKANIPGRIAFSVASLMDSRTILDSSGAEKLLGRGDMLYTSAELSKPKRIQGAFCSDGDIENVTEHLRKIGLPDYIDEVTEKQQTLGLGGVVLDGDDGEIDDMLDEARELILNERKASASYLQRRLRIGYARAARILDLLEQQGVVGPADGAKPREILINKGERDEAQEFIDAQEQKSKKANQSIFKTDYSQEENAGQLKSEDQEISEEETEEDLEEEGIDDFGEEEEREEEIEKLSNREIEGEKDSRNQKSSPHGGSTEGREISTQEEEIEEKDDDLREEEAEGKEEVKENNTGEDKYNF